MTDKKIATPPVPGDAVTYDVIGFDLDDTLIGWGDVDYVTAMRESLTYALPDDTELTEPLLQAGLDKERDVLLAACDAYDLPADEVWRDSRVYDVGLQQDHFRDGRRTPFPAATETLAALHADYPLALMTNNQHAVAAYAADFFGWDRFFDAVIGLDQTLGDLANAKPDPHYLEQMLDELDADDGLYVGDSWRDVAAAANVSDGRMDSVLIDRGTKDCMVPDGGVTPTYTISSLAELDDLL